MIAFLEAPVITTPLGDSLPLDLGVALEAEYALKSYRAAVGGDDPSAVARSVVGFLHLAGLDAAQGDVGQVLTAFVSILNGLWDVFQDLPPAFKSNPNDPPVQPEGWEYPGRALYAWVHLLASRYGWTREAILSLHVREAARYVQEIELSTTFEREWQHSLTELAYAYDKTSKKSRYVPLPRPYWMNRPVEMPKPTLIPRKFVPIGNALTQEELIRQYNSRGSSADSQAPADESGT